MITIDTKIVETLEELLHEAKLGNLISFVITAKYKDGISSTALRGPDAIDAWNEVQKIINGQAALKGDE